MLCHLSLSMPVLWPREGLLSKFVLGIGFFFESLASNVGSSTPLLFYFCFLAILFSAGYLAAYVMKICSVDQKTHKSIKT